MSAISLGGIFSLWFIDAAGFGPVSLIANMRRDMAHDCEHNYPHVKQFKHVTDVLHSKFWCPRFFSPCMIWPVLLFAWIDDVLLFAHNNNQNYYCCLSSRFLKLHKYSRISIFASPFASKCVKNCEIWLRFRHVIAHFYGFLHKHLLLHSISF